MPTSLRDLENWGGRQPGAESPRLYACAPAGLTARSQDVCKRVGWRPGLHSAAPAGLKDREVCKRLPSRSALTNGISYDTAHQDSQARSGTFFLSADA